MMTKCLALILVTSLSLTSWAGAPKTGAFASKTLRSLRLREQALLDIRDAKGESLLQKFSTVTQNEAGLWAHLDPVRDNVHGTSTARAYEDFRISKTGSEVIVAVIDSGVDIRHPDLQGKIWSNAAELYGLAGVDDDQNGYVDDIFGWNFLGNKNGQNVNGQTLEVTREYVRLKTKDEAGLLTPDEKTYFEKVKSDYEERKSETQANLSAYQSIADAYVVLKAAGLKEETVAAVQALSSQNEQVLKAKEVVLRFLPRGITSTRAASVIENLKEAVEYHYNTEFNSSVIVGDDPLNLEEKGYGNNDVQGPDASHGTHVAGIIAAVRNNNMGIDGQALRVKIMSLRAVPNGDERDKDVANSIRYAVDHGAKVVNMSFGKDYVFNKAIVDKAVQYAESKGVLLVHAAGNDGKNTESQDNNYPNRRIQTRADVIQQASNWLEVGASDQNNLAMQLPARFSNFGKTSVDVFAPGVGIVSTVPGNAYAKFNGTSMAAPEVAGVAALLLNKFPNATLAEVRDAILSSVNTYGDMKVKQPGSGTEVAFSELSVTGGTVNARKAMLKLMANLPLL